MNSSKTAEHNNGQHLPSCWSSNDTAKQMAPSVERECHHNRNGHVSAEASIQKHNRQQVMTSCAIVQPLQKEGPWQDHPSVAWASTSVMGKENPPPLQLIQQNIQNWPGKMEHRVQLLPIKSDSIDTMALRNEMNFGGAI